MLTLILISLENLHKSRFLAAINRGHVVGRLPEAGRVGIPKNHSYFNLSHNIIATQFHFP